jgi:hypothetical protein
VHVPHSNDPGSKNNLPVSSVPPKPAVLAGNHTFDNVVFSNVQRRLPVNLANARARNSIYFRLPGLTSRPLRPRKFMYVPDAKVTSLRTVTVKTTKADGSLTLASAVLTGGAGEDFVAAGVNPGDIVIVSSTSVLSMGRYIVHAVAVGTLTLDRAAKGATDLGGVTYHVINRGSFVDESNRLIELGALEIRTSAGALVNPVVPV